MNRLDKEELSALRGLLRDRLGAGDLTLGNIAVGCSHDVYCAQTPQGEKMFVKVVGGELRGEIERTLDFLSRSGGSALLPGAIIDKPLEWRGRIVSCLSWQKGDVVFPERMSDAQADSLVSAYKEAAGLFAKSAHIAPPRDLPALFGSISDYAARFPFVKPLLKPLLSIPEPERTYGAAGLVAIHGDFQYRNYAFTGDRVSALYDFDTIMYGCPAEDLLYAIAGRYARSEASANDRARLAALLIRMIGKCGWPLEEWRRALAVCRIRVAAKRISKRPRNPLLAIDIARRDAPYRVLADAIPRTGK